MTATLPYTHPSPRPSRKLVRAGSVGIALSVRVIPLSIISSLFYARCWQCQEPSVPWKLATNSCLSLFESLCFFSGIPFGLRRAIHTPGEIRAACVCVWHDFSASYKHYCFALRKLINSWQFAHAIMCKLIHANLKHAIMSTVFLTDWLDYKIDVLWSG